MATKAPHEGWSHDQVPCSLRASSPPRGEPESWWKRGAVLGHSQKRPHHTTVKRHHKRAALQSTPKQSEGFLADSPRCLWRTGAATNRTQKTGVWRGTPASRLLSDLGGRTPAMPWKIRDCTRRKTDGAHPRPSSGYVGGQETGAGGRAKRRFRRFDCAGGADRRSAPHSGATGAGQSLTRCRAAARTPHRWRQQLSGRRCGGSEMIFGPLFRGRPDGPGPKAAPVALFETDFRAENGPPTPPPNHYPPDHAPPTLPKPPPPPPPTTALNHRGDREAASGAGYFLVRSGSAPGTSSGSPNMRARRPALALGFYLEGPRRAGGGTLPRRRVRNPVVVGWMTTTGLKERPAD